MRKIVLSLLAVVAVAFIANAQLFSKQKTVNVIPDNARIYVGGIEVGTGTYTFTLKNDYEVLKLSAPGYFDKTVKVYKQDKQSILTFRLERDESWAASEASSDMANKWMTVVVKDGMSFDEAWQRINFYITDLFPNPQVSDKAAGWYRSSWEIQKFGQVAVRTRVEIKKAPGQDQLTFKVRLQSELAWTSCGLNDQCFNAWERVLRQYKEATENLLTALGSNL